jgi:hypothetical protein
VLAPIRAGPPAQGNASAHSAVVSDHSEAASGQRAEGVRSYGLCIQVPVLKHVRNSSPLIVNVYCCTTPRASVSSIAHGQ